MFRQLLRDLQLNLLSPRLMPLKFLFLAMYAGHTALYPYLAVHLQSLGFGADKAAVLLAIVPLVSIMGPPAAGLIADKLGNFKAFFSGMVAMSGVVSLLLLAVPKVPDPPGLSLTLVTDYHPPGVPMGVDSLAELVPHEEANLTVDAEFLQWLVVTRLRGCTLASDYQTTMDGLDKVNIGLAEPKSSVNLTQVAVTDNVTLMAVTSHHPVSCPSDTPRKRVNLQGVSLLLQVLEDYNTTLKLPHTSPLDIHWPVSPHQDAAAVAAAGAEGREVWWRTGCEMRVPGLCEPNIKELIAAESVSFWTYLMVRSLLNSAINAAFTLFEGATLSLLMEHEGDYGLQRMWGYIGAMVVTPISGWMIDSASAGLTTTDYRPAYYFFVCMMVISGIVALSVDLKFRQPSDAVLANIFTFVKNPECLMLFLAMLLAGSFHGFLEAFLFWHLGDMGASRYLLGLTVTAGAGAAVPCLVLATPVVRRLGHVNMLGIAFLMYAVRFAGYASITRPEQAMLFELLEGVTMGLMLTAAYMYSASLSTKHTIVSLQAIAGTLHNGVGKGLGTLIGGHMFHHMGARKTFRIFTMGSIVSSILFFIFHLLYIRRRSRRVCDLPIFGIDPNEALISVELSRLADKTKIPGGRSHGRGSIAYLTDTSLNKAVVEVAPRYRRVCPRCLAPSDTADTAAQTAVSVRPFACLESDVSSDAESSADECQPLQR